MITELSNVGVTEWRRCIGEVEDDAAWSAPSQIVENVPGEPWD
jgi:hypothetical protein